MSHPQRPINLIAALVIQHGKPFVHTESYEGDAESGPYALDFFGYRWGKVHLILGPRGTISLEWPDRDDFFGVAIHYLERGLIGYQTISNKLYTVRKEHYAEQSRKSRLICGLTGEVLRG